MKRVQKFETEGGQIFDTEAEAQAAEKIERRTAAIEQLIENDGHLPREGREYVSEFLKRKDVLKNLALILKASE
jgi:hypothetical protein